jgi:PleD family two-component response regulator
LNMNTHIHTPQSFMDLLQQERARVHRNGRPFSLILFRLSEHADSEKTVHPALFPTIVKRVRNIDQVGLYDHDHIGLLLPQTAGEGAKKIADELFRVPAIASHISDCEVFVYP